MSEIFLSTNLLYILDYILFKVDMLCLFLYVVLIMLEEILSDLDCIFFKFFIIFYIYFHADIVKEGFEKVLNR